MIKMAIKYDPFEIVEISEECDICGEIRKLTIVDDGDQLCKECSSKFYGYILKGYEKEHEFWKKEILPTLEN